MPLLDEPLVINMVDPDPTERMIGAIEQLDARMREMQADMNRQFAALVDRYVPRNELVTWFAATDREQRDNRAQIDLLRTALDASDQRRRIETRWALGFAVSLTLVFLGLINFVVNHLPH